MDYEKAYKEALARARKYKLKEDLIITQDIFPELRENEDERIRKEIFDYLWKEKIFLQEVHSSVENSPKYRFVMDAIAWLEKQEDCEYIKKDCLEHIKQSWYKEGFIDGKYSGGTSKEWTINDATTLKELIDFLENGTAKLQHDITRYANWLKIQFTPIEKQGEQKPQRMVSAEAKEAMYDKPKWSEEDEEEFDIAIKTLYESGQSSSAEWLESLKQRIV